MVHEVIPSKYHRLNLLAVCADKETYGNVFPMRGMMNTKGKPMPTNPLPQSELDRLVERASEWAASPEGQQSIRESLRITDEMSSKLREAHRADVSKLYEPVTL
jgi:hypothetical protein